MDSPLLFSGREGRCLTLRETCLSSAFTRVTLHSFSCHSFCRSLPGPGAWTWESHGSLLTCCATQTPGGQCVLRLAVLAGWVWGLRHTILAAVCRTPQAGGLCSSQDAMAFVLDVPPVHSRGKSRLPLKFPFCPNGSLLPDGQAFLISLCGQEALSCWLYPTSCWGLWAQGTTWSPPMAAAAG